MENFVLRRPYLTVTPFGIMQIQQHVNIDIFIVRLMVHYYYAFNNYKRHQFASLIFSVGISDIIDNLIL